MVLTMDTTRAQLGASAPARSSAALIGLASKTRFFPSRVDAAIDEAVLAVRGTPRSTPVVLDGHDIAVVRGEGWQDPRVRVWLPPRVREHRKWAGFATYQALEEAMRKGAKFTARYLNSTTMASSWNDYWPTMVLPTAGAFTGAAATAVQFNDTVSGGMKLQQAGGSKANYISRMSLMSGSTGCIGAWLYDRVLTYEACAIVAASTNMVNGVAAQRYVAAGEPGLCVFVGLQTATGATVSQITVMNYTDQGGNAGAMPYNATAGSHIQVSVSGAGRGIAPGNGSTLTPWSPFMPLAAGDTGVRSIADWTCTAANAGTVYFCLMYPLCYVPTIDRGSTTVNEGAWPVNLPFTRIYDGAHLSLLGRGATTSGATPSVRGHIEVACG